MSKSGGLRAICAATLLSSAGFLQSCVLPSDGSGAEGGSPSGGSDSAGGNSDGGSMSGTGAVAGGSGAMGGGTGALGGAGESGGGGTGALGGVGGAMGGTSGSAGGIAGSMVSMGGCSNYGGWNAAGWLGQAGIGGANVAGSGASGGEAGSGNGGQGGGAFGGASGSAAAGSCNAADPSCAGMSGGAGAPPSAGNGGTGGVPSLPLVLSTKLIDFPATECGTTPTSKTLTITNPSSASKTWRAIPGGAFTFLADPTSSSLAPGEAVTVTVTPPFIPLRSQPSNSSQLMTGVLLIADGAVYQTITLSEPIAGAFYSWTPASLNFGIVAINTSATLHLTQSGDSSGRAASDNAAFSGTYSASSWHEWTFSFNATTVGVQTATFTWKSVPYNRAPCTPDTFTATAFVPPQ